MIDARHLIKVSMAWSTIVYLVCFGEVAIYPQVRTLFAEYALHINLNLGEHVMTVSTFAAGLVLWNIAAAEQPITAGTDRLTVKRPG